jgi:hypothetical protein
VYLNAEHINLASATCKKLKQRWFGPFMVWTVVSPLAYELSLKIDHVCIQFSTSAN